MFKKVVTTANYEGSLFQSPVIGNSFIITGRTLSKAKQFIVNLSRKKVLLDYVDIPLQLVIRFPTDDILRNSFINNEWGISEVHPDKSEICNPIIAGLAFKICILIGDGIFHIAVNDFDFCTYKFRTSLESICAISICGDLEKISKVDHRKYFPLAWPPLNQDLVHVNFSADIPEKYNAGHVIVITGIASGSKKGSFFLRFNERATSRQLFHFNPRFDESVVVVNCMNSLGQWLKNEVRLQNFPFKLSKKFRLAIAICEDSFDVAVNGSHLIKYPVNNFKELLNSLTGFKLFAQNGLEVDVISVDQVFINNVNCYGFEDVSNLDYVIEA